jgi:cardiolipin synthase (CMP-forming)
MNLPNILSLFRLVLTFFFVIAVVYQRFHLALFLFILQAVSDLLDGFFARRMGTKTVLGAYLDPLADKVMLASAYIVLNVQNRIPLWLVVIVLGRDIVIASGFFLLLKKGLSMGPVPTFLSKATTVFQMLTVVYVLFLSVPRPLDHIFFYMTALLTIVTGCQYVLSGWTVFFKKESN